LTNGDIVTLLMMLSYPNHPNHPIYYILGLIYVWNEILQILYAM